MKSKSRNRMNKSIAMATTFALLPTMAIVQPFDTASANTEVKGTTIYVASSSNGSNLGTGEESSPYTDLNMAIEAAKEGDTISLLSDITFSKDSQLSILTLNKRLVFQGNGHKLNVVSTNIAVEKPIIFMNIKLNLDGNSRLSGSQVVDLNWDSSILGGKIDNVVKVLGSNPQLRSAIGKNLVTSGNANDDVNISFKYFTIGLNIVKDQGSYKIIEAESTTALREAANTAVDPNKTALDILNEQFQGTEVVSATNMNNIKDAILYNFEKKGDDVAMSNVVTLKQHLGTSDMTTYYIPLINKFKADNGIPHSASAMTEAQRKMLAEYAPIAQAEALKLVNANITNNDEFEALSAEAKIELESIIIDLLNSKTGLTIEQLKTDLPSIFRGLFLLQQQYNFEDNLIKTLIFNPETISGRPSNGLSAYDRIVKYGGRTYNTRQSQLIQNEALFTQRGISIETGFATIEDLVSKLAEKQGLTPEQYYKKQTEALLAQSEGQNVYESIKNNKRSWYLPLLAQGKGVYVASTANAITIGMLETYKDLYPNEAVPKVRGQEQPTEIFFDKVLKGFDNYMKFLNDVKRNDVPFVTVSDSMNHKYDVNPNNVGEWSKPSGEDAAYAVRRFLSPMNIYTSYTKSGVGIGGVSTSSSSLEAKETRLLHPNMQGVGLFSHEMTHGNDEAALFGGVYRVHGRRNGQGPEIYARGLFEAIDNSQDTSAYKPVFNLNTAISIDKKDSRVQSTEPLNSKDKMEKYFKNLVDLVTYLEAKEAEAAFEILTPEEKAIYFNKVSQVTPKKDGHIHTERVNFKSTNDQFAPFGVMGNPALTEPTKIADLVNQDAVSGQFIPNGRTPFIGNLQTNQYDAVPLLESFYAASVADPGNNTVGDISFKRHAYEILGWKGWDAFVEYVSDAHSTDQEAYTSILNGDAPDWATYKINKYNALSKLKAVNSLWDDEELNNRLKEAIKKDLTFIKSLRANADPTLRNYTDTQSEKNALVQAATNINFDKNATNVRAVKLDILRRALNHNELMSTVLREDTPVAPTKYTVDYNFLYIGSTEANFNDTGIALPQNKEAEENTEITTTENYTQLVTSRDNKGQWKFNGWNPTTFNITRNTTVNGTWEFREYQEIPIVEEVQKDDQLDKGVRQVVSDGEVGLRSAFDNSIIRDMKKKIIKEGTREPSPILNRQPAMDAINKAAEDKIRDINNNNLLTIEEKNKAIDLVNIEKNQGIENVQSATTQDGIESSKDTSTQAIAAVSPETITKPTNKNIVSDLADAKREEIRNNNQLVDTEKSLLLETIDAIVLNANSNIDKAAADADVIAKKDEAISALNNLVVEPVAKSTARNTINTLADGKLKEINDNSGLTDEEKAPLIAEVNSIREAALASIDNSQTLTNVHQTVADNTQAIDNIDIEPAYKKNAIASLDDTVKEKIVEIESNKVLTDEEKSSLLDEVKALVDNGKNSINQSSKNSEVDNAKNEAIDSVNNLAIEPKIKPQALTALNKAAEDKKAQIQNADITEEQRTDLLKQVDDILKDAITAIDGSVKNLDVNNIKDTGVLDINNIQIPKKAADTTDNTDDANPKDNTDDNTSDNGNQGGTDNTGNNTGVNSNTDTTDIPSPDTDKKDNEGNLNPSKDTDKSNADSNDKESLKDVETTDKSLEKSKENTKAKSKSKKAPKTTDSRDITGLIAIALGSLSSFATILLRRKKEK